MHCLHPINIRNPAYRPELGKDLYVQVPCGKCIACQERRRSEWAFRLETEAKSRPAWFVTLTYDPHYLPTVNPLTGEIVDTGTLNPKDVTNFLKRYRKHFDSQTISYFYCGEYGASGFRPHYHMILFQDASYQDIVDTVEDTWKLGFTKVDPANLERFRYVAKYVVKLGNDRINQSALMPFARMSTRIDTGETYYKYDSEGNVILDKKTGEPKEYKKTTGLGTPSKQVIEWKRDNDDYSSRLSNGEVISTPRYIRDKTFSRVEQEIHKKTYDNMSRAGYHFRENNEGFLKAFRARLADDVAWETFKVKQFYKHYLDKQNGRF